MKIRNWTLLITLSALVCFFYFYITPGYLHPAEDATILFNYAQNLKDTGVISYYPGGPRVDGSTDFLFILLTSGALHFVSDAYQAALLVSAISTMLLLFILFRLLDTKSLSLQYLALLLVVFSQQIWAAVLGYGTFLYAMMICWAILAYWKGRISSLAIASFFAVLCRPDALVTVIPLMLHKTFSDREKILPNIGVLILNFAVPLSLYAIFRWWYFGSILPLSFDINTAGYDKVWKLFPINSIHHVKSYALYYIYPGLIGLMIYFIKSKFKKKAPYYVLIISTIILPMLAYLTIRENLDFARRYFIVPYLGTVIVMCLLIRNYKSIILSIFGILLLIKVGNTSIDQGVKSLNHFYNNMFDFSTELNHIQPLRVATSEAGIIAWKGGHPTLDIWGLNTPDLTNRVITPKDLDEWKADIIILLTNKDHYIKVPDDSISTEKTWLNMSRQVINYMEKNQFITYLMPYDNRQYITEQSDNLGLAKSLLKFISENNKVSGRHELVAIDPNSSKSNELIQIVEKYGGKQFKIK